MHMNRFYVKCLYIKINALVKEEKKTIVQKVKVLQINQY